MLYYTCSQCVPYTVLFVYPDVTDTVLYMNPGVKDIILYVYPVCSGHCISRETSVFRILHHSCSQRLLDTALLV